MSIYLEGTNSNAKDNQASTKSITSMQTGFSLGEGGAKKAKEKLSLVIADTQLPHWAAVICRGS